MNGRWSRHDDNRGHVPVEMRFVDMFMTALGALIFIILLLIFLLPQTAQNRSQAAQKSQTAETEKDYDKKVLQRWFSVMLLLKDCKKGMPYVYVRWDVDLFDLETGNPVPRMKEFSAAAFTSHPLFGHNNIRFSRQLHNVALNDQNTGKAKEADEGPVEVLVYNGVMGGSAPGDLYLSLVAPTDSDHTECRVSPLIFGSSRTSDDLPSISLNRSHPFAWLAHLELEQGGSLNVSDPSLLEHEKFSSEQSRALCEKHQICDTEDAYWLQRRAASQHAEPDGALAWETGVMLDSHGRVKSATSREDCADACLRDEACVAVEYTEKGNYCFMHDKLGKRLQAGLWVTGLKRKGAKEEDAGAGQMSLKRDHFVPDDVKPAERKTKLSKAECAKACTESKSCSAAEYHKPVYECWLFDKAPTISKAGRANSPRDVLVKGGESARKPKQKEAEDIKSNGPFTLYDNRDIVGADLKTIKRIERNKCEALCAKETKCAAYSYDKWNRWCFLKSGGDRVRLDPNSVSGLRSGLKEPGLATTPPKLVRYTNKAFPYTGQATLTAPSLEDCEVQCRDDEKCVALTYFRKSKQCRLMETTDEYFSDSTADSSVKRQEPVDAVPGQTQ